MDDTNTLRMAAQAVVDARKDKNWLDCLERIDDLAAALAQPEPAPTPPAVPAVVDAEAVAWQVRDPKIQESWGPPVTKKSIVDRLEADGFEVRALGVIAHPAPASASEPERRERAEPCPKPGCNAHWGITCSEGHMRLANCPDWSASASASGASEALQAMVDNERELGLGYETGASEALPPVPPHPEPHIMRWSMLEEEAIRRHGEACAAAALRFALPKPAGQGDGEAAVPADSEQAQPGLWDVFSGPGAHVASGLTFSEAADYMTPDRIDRGWTLVCVINTQEQFDAARHPTSGTEGEASHG